MDYLSSPHMNDVMARPRASYIGGRGTVRPGPDEKTLFSPVKGNGIKPGAERQRNP
jgi:hypothetical protein